MQKFLLNLAGLGLLTAVLFFSSCDPDPVDPPSALGPEIAFLADTDVINSDGEVTIGESFSIKVQLTKGDNPLQSLEIQEGGVKLTTDRFTIDGGAITSNNPLLITGTDVDGVTYLITINQGAHVVGDFTLYNFIVSDGNKTANKDIAITTAGVPGTDLSMSISGVLFNQAGPSGTGGLDLDAGTGTGSADATAEIRDLGIDCTISAPNENWRAEFGTVNGASMVRVDASAIENFSFDGVDKKEAIEAAYGTASPLASGVSQAPNCDETAVTNVTGTVAANDVFAVLANGTYYLVRVDAVNFSGGDNNDNYSLSIKY